MISDNWTRENLAYLAGLLEGEGSFMFNGNNCLLVQVQMTDEDVIARAKEIIGCGYYNGPYVNKNPKKDGTFRKPYWQLQVRGYQAYALMAAVYPWMGDRRKEKIRESMKLWTDFQLSKPARRSNGVTASRNSSY